MFLPLPEEFPVRQPMSRELSGKSYSSGQREYSPQRRGCRVFLKPVWFPGREGFQERRGHRDYPVVPQPFPVVSKV